VHRSTGAQTWLWTAYRRPPLLFLGPFPCAACGHAVRWANDRLFRVRLVCSPRCDALIRTAARRAQRQATWQRSCGTCGDIFIARRDARTCSPRCRKRAYRLRQHTP
jgi:hypothetical protein